MKSELAQSILSSVFPFAVSLTNFLPMRGCATNREQSELKKVRDPRGGEE